MNGQKGVTSSRPPHLLLWATLSEGWWFVVKTGNYFAEITFLLCKLYWSCTEINHFSARSVKLFSSTLCYVDWCILKGLLASNYEEYNFVPLNPGSIYPELLLVFDISLRDFNPHLGAYSSGCQHKMPVTLFKDLVVNNRNCILPNSPMWSSMFVLSCSKRENRYLFLIILGKIKEEIKMNNQQINNIKLVTIPLKCSRRGFRSQAYLFVVSTDC